MEERCQPNWKRSSVPHQLNPSVITAPSDGKDKRVPATGFLSTPPPPSPGPPPPPAFALVTSCFPQDLPLGLKTSALVSGQSGSLRVLWVFCVITTSSFLIILLSSLMCYALQGPQKTKKKKKFFFPHSIVPFPWKFTHKIENSTWCKEIMHAQRELQASAGRG